MGVVHACIMDIMWLFAAVTPPAALGVSLGSAAPSASALGGPAKRAAALGGGRPRERTPSGANALGSGSPRERTAWCGALAFF